MTTRKSVNEHFLSQLLSTAIMTWTLSPRIFTTPEADARYAANEMHVFAPWTWTPIVFDQYRIFCISADTIFIRMSFYLHIGRLYQQKCRRLAYRYSQYDIQHCRNSIYSAEAENRSYTRLQGFGGLTDTDRWPLPDLRACGRCRKRKQPWYTWKLVSQVG